MTTRERAEAVKAAATEIDAAIVAKGGTTAGGLRNAAAAIAALPSGGEKEMYDGYETVAKIRIRPYTGKRFGVFVKNVRVVADWGDGSVETLVGYKTCYHDYAEYGDYQITLRPENQSQRLDCDVGNGTYAVYEIKIGSCHNLDGALYSTPDCVVYENKNNTHVLNNYHPKFGNASEIVGDITIGSDGRFDITFNGDKRPSALIKDGVKIMGQRWSGGNFRKLISENPVVNIGGYGFNYCSNLCIFEGFEKCVFDSGELAFSGCSKLLFIPFEIVFDGTTNANAFASCEFLGNIPKITTNNSLSFAPCTGIKDKQSVLDFASNLNACPNAGQTITFNAAIKTLLGDDYTTVEQTLTAKNWAVAW